MSLIDGKILAEDIYNSIKSNSIKSNRKLGVIQVGDDIASSIYIRHKELACKRIGAKFELYKYPLSITTDELVQVLHQLNNDNTIHGYIIQFPLPDHINKKTIVSNINVMKDIDCLTPENIGLLCMGCPRYIPATPLGILKIIEKYNISIRGKCIVIIGKSDIVGKPLNLLLGNEFGLGGTVICCDKNTIDLVKYVQMADVLIVAAGVGHLITNKMKLKHDIVIIDIGIRRLENGKIIGDVDLTDLSYSLATPVPGGVGPMTVVGLMLNLVGHQFY